MSVSLFSLSGAPALCWLSPSGVVDQDRARRERKPLSKALVRERSDPVACEPEALRHLAKQGLEGVTPGPDHAQPEE
jgi:hypothetical protein